MYNPASCHTTGLLSHQKQITSTTILPFSSHGFLCQEALPQQQPFPNTLSYKTTSFPLNYPQQSYLHQHFPSISPVPTSPITAQVPTPTEADAQQA